MRKLSLLDCGDSDAKVCEMLSLRDLTKDDGSEWFVISEKCFTNPEVISAAWDPIQKLLVECIRKRLDTKRSSIIAPRNTNAETKCLLQMRTTNAFNG